MSSALDIAGAIVTQTADTDYNYFTMTDSVGGGTLVLEAGSRTIFDDATGAGFLATSLAFTLTINGNSSHECEIKSINRYPDHRWTPPNALCTGVTTQCTFTNYSASFPSGIVHNNPTWIVEPYAYCTANEVINLTGTTLSDAILAEIIGQASNEINNRLAVDGITVASTDAVLAAICRNKSIAGVMRRMIADGTRMGAVTVDGITTGDNPNTMIREVEAKAEKMLDYYVIANRPSNRKRLWALKVNAHG